LGVRATGRDQSAAGGMMLEHVRQVRDKLKRLRRGGMSRAQARDEARVWAREKYGIDPEILKLVLRLI